MMGHGMGIRLPNSATNGTLASTDTGILDTPGARAGRNRLSFLKRQQPQQTQSQPPEPMLNGLSLNGISHKDFPAAPRGLGGDRENEDDGVSTSSRSRSKSQSRSKSGSKENRRSFFGGASALGSIGRGRGRQTGRGEKDEESEWVTQSDLASQFNGDVNGNGGGYGGKGGGRRSSSSNRPTTAKSGGGAGSLSLSRDGSVGSKVGSVRKRLSRLTLGKKSSKASVLVGSVAEED